MRISIIRSVGEYYRTLHIFEDFGDRDVCCVRQTFTLDKQGEYRLFDWFLQQSKDNNTYMCICFRNE